MDPITLEEVFSFGHDGLVIYGTTVLVPKRGSGARLIVADDRGILMWPVLMNHTIVAESVCLSELRYSMSVTGLFSVDLGSIGSFIVLGLSGSDNSSLGMVIYKMNQLPDGNENLTLVQVFPTKYRVMDIKKVSNSTTDHYLMVLGSDSRLHAYYFDAQGSLHRTRSRYNHCRQWELRLGLLQSEDEGDLSNEQNAFGLPLRLLIDSGKFHSEAVVAFSSGVVTWDRTTTSFRSSAEWLRDIPTIVSPMSALKSPPRAPIHMRRNRSEGSINFEHTPYNTPMNSDRSVGIALSSSVDGIALFCEDRPVPILFPPSPAIMEASTSSVPRNHGTEASSSSIQGRRNHMANFNTSVMFDGAVSCLCFYRRHSENYLHLHAYSAPYTLASEKVYLVVGLASGAAAIMSLDNGADSSSVKPLPGSYEHGSVQAITVGDVKGNGYNDIVSTVVH
jgi:hypothetical protein